MVNRENVDDKIFNNYEDGTALADLIQKISSHNPGKISQQPLAKNTNNPHFEREKNPQSREFPCNSARPVVPGDPTPVLLKTGSFFPEPVTQSSLPIRTFKKNGSSLHSDKDLLWLDDPQTLYLTRKLHVSDSLSFVNNLARMLSSSCVLDAMKKVKLMADIIASADSVPYPVFAINRDGKVIAWNKGMECLTGIPGREMIGKGNYAYAVPFYGIPRPMLVDYLIHTPSRSKPHYQNIESGSGDVFISDREWINIRGQPYLIWGKGSRIYDEDGMTIAAIQSIGVGDDSSPLVQSHKGNTSIEIDQSCGISSRLKTNGNRGELSGTRDSAMISHEGRNPGYSHGIEPGRDITGPFIQKKHADINNAFGRLVLTEDNLLRNYRLLSEEPVSLTDPEKSVTPSEEILTRIILYAHEGIIAYDRNLQCILWNSFMEHLTGIPSEKILGQRAFDMFPALKDAGAYLLLEQALSGETVESSDISFHIPGSGKQTWVRLIFSTLYDRDGSITGIIVIVQDTTAKKVMEYALQTTIIQLMESEEKYRNVFNAKNDPLLLVDTQTRNILDLNTASSTLYGYGQEEMLIMSLADLFVEPEKSEDLMDRNNSGIRMYHQRKKDGTTFPADISSAFFDLKGRSVLILSIRDLSSVYQIADALRLANTKLNLLIGITRHDIINNLTVLMGYNDLLKHRLTDTQILAMLEKQESTLNSIHRQIEFTREYFDLGVKSPLWQNICDIATRAYSQFINIIPFTCDTGDLEIYADPLLEKVFYNLFDNAFRYSEGITRISVYCMREGSELVLIFGDDGQGILPEHKKRIFNRGFGKNTGLGLFLSREILAITRIEISETGEYEKGARFELRIPEGLFRFSGTGHSIKASGSETLDLPA
jgi:PAS domain S-box-containing protein